jgi:DNA-binding NarL/FixJ family response regulator
VAQGHSSKAIVHQLFISECAVALHLTAIFNKLGVNTRAQVEAQVTDLERILQVSREDVVRYRAMLSKQ